MGWTLYDRRTGARAAGATFLTLVVALLITASTDEGGLAWPTRIGRVLPLAPVCAAVGMWLATARARARGELHALEALGRSPWQAAAPPTAGAAVVVAICALALAGSRAIDLNGFFPAAPHVTSYVHVEKGGFADRGRRIHIGERGEISSLAGGDVPPESPLASGPRWGRASASLSMVIAGIAFPLASARLGSARGGRRTSTRVLRTLVGATLVASIVVFQTAASGRAPALLALIPPLALLAATAFRYREDAWKTTRG
jgi:hypothetical protein